MEIGVLLLKILRFYVFKTTVNGGLHFEITIKSENYQTQFISQKHAYTLTNVIFVYYANNHFMGLFYESKVSNFINCLVDCPICMECIKQFGLRNTFILVTVSLFRSFSFKELFNIKISTQVKTSTVIHFLQKLHYLTKVSN